MPEYFQAFGVPSARSYFEDKKKKAFEERRSKAHRFATYAERRCMEVLLEVLNDLAPEIKNLFKVSEINMRSRKPVPENK